VRDKIIQMEAFCRNIISQDMVLCRAYRGLEKRIAKEGQREGLKCQVRYWAGAWEVEEIFKSLPAELDTV